MTRFSLHTGPQKFLERALPRLLIAHPLLQLSAGRPARRSTSGTRSVASVRIFANAPGVGWDALDRLEARDSTSDARTWAAFGDATRLGAAAELRAEREGGGVLPCFQSARRSAGALGATVVDDRHVPERSMGEELQ